MNLQKDKYIIVEIIPTHSDPEKGFIAQLSALKLDGIKLEDRFDYRVEDRFIENDDIHNMIQYDNIILKPRKIFKGFCGGFAIRNFFSTFFLFIFDFSMCLY